jgi:hypothetical protein
MRSFDKARHNLHPYLLSSFKADQECIEKFGDACQ